MLAREVRRLAIPAIVHSLLQTLVFVVDRIMLGMHDDASLAAMQLGGNLEWSIWSVFVAFEVGTIARVGRHVGANEPALARRAARVSLVMAAGIGAALALATPLILALLPRIATTVSPAAMGEAQRYLGVTIGASPLVFIGMTAVATLQAGGDTRTPLAIGIFANVVHVGTNWALIPTLGARGAGISTAITFGIEAALAVAALASTRRPVSIRGPRVAGPASTETRELARIGIPAFLERLLYHVGYVAYVLLVARLGDAAMAANQSLISVESICFLSGDGFGIAAAALVAQKLGAQKPEEARRAAWIATRYAVIALTCFGLAAFLPLFSSDAEVVSIGRRAIPVLALAQPLMATGIVLAQAMRGAGRTREALVVSLIGAVFVRLGATYWFGIVLGMGLTGAWLGSTLDWLVRSVLLAALHRKGSARIER